MLTREAAEALCRRILEGAGGDGAEVVLESRRIGHTRFAGTRVTTGGDSHDVQATLTLIAGGRRASVRFNAVDGRGIGRAQTLGRELVRSAPETLAMPPLLGPQEYAAPDAYFDTTAALSADVRVEAIRQVSEVMRSLGLAGTGFLVQTAAAVAVANTAGLFAYHRSTLASFTVTARTGDGRGSGWAGATHNDWSRMTHPRRLAERAAERARQSVEARPIDPGRYTVVLEPTAAGNLVQLLGGALDRRAAEEGRSFFAGRDGGTKLGERVADPRVSLVSDPLDPLLLAQPFTDEGYPLRRRVWIRDGVLNALAAEREWAARRGLEPVPWGGGLRLDGGSGTTADLVAGVERGLLVTRFWYIRGVDERTLRYTGVTRDGVLAIESGRVVGAVKNLRFNEGIVDVLNRLDRVGAAERVVASEANGLGPAVAVPPLVVREFNFTAVSDAV